MFTQYIVHTMYCALQYSLNTLHNIHTVHTSDTHTSYTQATHTRILIQKMCCTHTLKHTSMHNVHTAFKSAQLANKVMAAIMEGLHQIAREVIMSLVQSNKMGLFL